MPNLVFKNALIEIRCFFIFLSIFLLYSCNETSKNIDVFFDGKFPNETYIESSVLKAIEQLNPLKICIFDNVLLVVDARQNPRFHFYDKNTLKKITDYVAVGNGPNEFSDPECNCQQFSISTYSNRNILIYEYSLGLVYKVNLDSVLRGNKNKAIIEKKFIPPQLVGSDNLFIVDNKIIGEAVSNKKYEYFSINLNDFKNFTQIKGPKRDKFFNSIKFNDRRNLERSFLSYGGKYFINSYYFINKVQILNPKLSIRKNIYYGNSKKYPKFKDPFNPNNVVYFLPPVTTDNFFYLAYDGKSNKDREDSKRIKPFEIHKFDYSGKPVHKFILDVPVFSFTVDEKHKIIYVITGLDDKPIVKFKIK